MNYYDQIKGLLISNEVYKNQLELYAQVKHIEETMTQHIHINLVK